MNNRIKTLQFENGDGRFLQSNQRRYVAEGNDIKRVSFKGVT